ncbi:MAG: Smr/MutS family protein [Thermoanaerobaculia bacterium]|nr:Smr/MutS family protein [Thermoanaerobaculia bacterium]
MITDKPEAFDDEGDDDFPGEVAFEITDVLDLHSFPPSQVKALVGDYLDLAHERGLREVRIIHGKGVGVQREMVRALLARDPRVEAFGDPPAEAGGWGATWVRMK